MLITIATDQSCSNHCHPKNQKCMNREDLQLINEEIHMICTKGKCDGDTVMQL